MEFRLIVNLSLLILSSSLYLQARGDRGGSVVFLDGSSRYIRNHAQDTPGKVNSMSLSEVAATISVLLGFAPPPSIPVDSSYKLNEVLLPNPFNKPHATFVLEISGIEEPMLFTHYLNTQTGNVYKSRISGSSNAKLELPGQDEVSVVRLDKSLDLECNAACLDKELSFLATWIGGSYAGSIESLDGRFSVPLASGSTLNLHLAKKADLQFASSLISLLRNVNKAVKIHEDLSENSIIPSEILTGHLTGIQALKEEYGWGDVAHQGVELLQTTLLKLFDMLQVAYGEKIVGVVILNKEPSAESGIMLDVTSMPRLSRFLVEASSFNTTVTEILLVRRTLAWITGIILLISTLIGIYMLFNMPLTRDTLLYSNVKLD
ncbi:hypothetical protein Cni_G01442 [Canna indica]|uniref:DUF7794 domain-containing protein n=1 Tax=Canna indica TaxID=4628 RepID=A0AAQ3JMK4_9LILI|nr:hypothetical protein Cni_G01442 [Canna indica]